LSHRLGDCLRQCADDLLTAADVVVPVPLHRSRRRARGFNQAAELAGRLGVPVLDVMKRTRATPSQTGLSAAARRSNVKNAFTLRRGLDVAGLRIVLVDDVSTTGATIEACARVLRDGGAVEVSAATAARVVSQPTE
jgi:ComF family protein